MSLRNSIYEKPLSLNEFQKIEPLKDDKKLEFR